MTYIKKGPQKITTRGKTHEQHVACAKAIAEGGSLYSAMKDNGWSEGQARKGKISLPEGVLSELKKRGKVLVQLGKSMTPEEQKHLIVGRLVSNISDGSDGGATSAKILGSQRDLNMWQSEASVGMIVITPVAGGEADAARLSEPD